MRTSPARRGHLRKLVGFLAALMMTMGAIIVPTPAHAATYTYQFNWRGNFAEAEYFAASECLFTNAYVLAVDGRIKIAGSSVQPDRFVYAYITQYDVCDGSYRIYADGYASISPSFDVDSRFNSAHLSVTMNLFDYLTGTQLPVVYDLAWVGYGSLYSLKQRQEYKAPGVLIKQSLNATQRNATASGSVAVGGVNVTPEPFEFGDIGVEKDGAWQVFH
jgi:hypothetical protein